MSTQQQRSEAARALGQARTQAKKEAARKNGELGGRPRTMRKCKYPSHRFSPKTGKCYGCGHTRESAMLATSSAT